MNEIMLIKGLGIELTKHSGFRAASSNTKAREGGGGGITQLGLPVMPVNL